MAGDYLHQGMLEMQSKHPGHVIAPRAQGTIQAFDAPDTETRNAMIHQLKL